MTAQHTPLPCLDFGDWHVRFPDRGQYAFLPSDDLKQTRSAPPSAEEVGLWLGRTESGISVIVPMHLDVWRGGVAAVALAVLHHDDQLRIAGHDVRFYEIGAVELEATSRLVGEHCPQCRTRLAKGTIVVQCPLCRSPYCQDCWEYLTNKRCYSRSCTYSPVPPCPRKGEE